MRLKPTNVLFVKRTTFPLSSLARICDDFESMLVIVAFVGVKVVSSIFALFNISWKTSLTSSFVYDIEYPIDESSFIAAAISEI